MLLVMSFSLDTDTISYNWLQFTVRTQSRDHRMEHRSRIRNQNVYYAANSGHSNVICGAKLEKSKEQV